MRHRCWCVGRHGAPCPATSAGPQGWSPSGCGQPACRRACVGSSHRARRRAAPGHSGLRSAAARRPVRGCPRPGGLLTRSSCAWGSPWGLASAGSRGVGHQVQLRTVCLLVGVGWVGLGVLSPGPVAHGLSPCRCGVGGVGGVVTRSSCARFVSLSVWGGWGWGCCHQVQLRTVCLLVGVGWVGLGVLSPGPVAHRSPPSQCGVWSAVLSSRVHQVQLRTSSPLPRLTRGLSYVSSSLRVTSVHGGRGVPPTGHSKSRLHPACLLASPGR